MSLLATSLLFVVAIGVVLVVLGWYQIRYNHVTTITTPVSSPLLSTHSMTLASPNVQLPNEPSTPATSLVPPVSLPDNPLTEPQPSPTSSPTSSPTPSTTTSTVNTIWTVGPWSVCQPINTSITCGEGYQTRNVSCKSGDCPIAQKPEDRQSCDLGQCAQWIAGEWSACTAPCGGGTQTRTFTCSNGNMCYEQGLSTGPTVQTCNTQPCPLSTTQSYKGFLGCADGPGFSTAPGGMPSWSLPPQVSVESPQQCLSQYTGQVTAVSCDSAGNCYCARGLASIGTPGSASSANCSLQTGQGNMSYYQGQTIANNSTATWAVYQR